MKVKDLQVLPTPDDFRHMIEGDSTECLCGPDVDYSGHLPIVTHRPLSETKVTGWVVLKPGEDVELVWGP